jgi:hypothetical protein
MTASFSPWELQDSQARLTVDALEGRLDCSQPFAGLAATFAGAALRLFRVELPPPSQSPDDQSPECYVRGCDLVCTYFQDDQRKLRGQVYWRALEWGPQRAPGVDLIVSVQTSLLDSDPTLKVRSGVQAFEVIGVKQFEPAAIEDIFKPDPNSHVVTLRGKMPACWLFRLSGAGFTYVEMVHPADFVSSCFQETSPGELEHSTQLFQGPLEKGVILRSRLRGVIVPRSGDVAAAIACYRDFAASEPPLTV